MYQKVEICGINTAQLKTITHEEIQGLLRRIAMGDDAARDELICCNLRLVLSVIQRFSRRCQNSDDLFQVGCIGLMKAIDNFDLNQNVRFSTYAVPMIVGEVRRYLRDNNMIRVSRSMRDLAYRAMQHREELASRLCREPSVREIADAINFELTEQAAEGTTPEKVTEKQVSSALDAILEPVSLFEPVFSEGAESISLIDQLYDTHNTPDNIMENLALREAVSKLGDREKQIISLRYYAGKTQVEVAKEIGISQAQVSRLEKSAIAMVRKEM